MYYELPIAIIPIDDAGIHISVDVLLNGKLMTLIVDTGASKTAFDLTSIERLKEDSELELNEELSSGLGTNSMESYFFEIENLELGSLSLKNYDSVAIDLSNINVTYEQLGLDSVDGVLGGDILFEYKAVVDYKKKVLRLFEDGRKSRIS